MSHVDVEQEMFSVYPFSQVSGRDTDAIASWVHAGGLGTSSEQSWPAGAREFPKQNPLGSAFPSKLILFIREKGIWCCI